MEKFTEQQKMHLSKLIQKFIYQYWDEYFDCNCQDGGYVDFHNNPIIWDEWKPMLNNMVDSIELMLANDNNKSQE